MTIASSISVPNRRAARVAAVPTTTPVTAPVSSGASLVLGFLVLEIACQLLVMFLGDTPVRKFIRMAAYGTSALLMLLVARRTKAHPSFKYLRWMPAILFVGLILPGHNTITAGLAQIAIYVSVIGPLSWVAGARLNFAAFRKIVLVFWMFQIASAATGVLQTRYPDRFRGAIDGAMMQRDKTARSAMTITLADGTRMYRPWGLTDSPGGASSAGQYAIILGMGVLLAERNRLLKLIAVGGMIVGLFVVYLCQMRTPLVMCGLCALALTAALARRGELVRMGTIGTVLAGVALAGTTWAFAVGGKATAERFSTLLADDPTKVYGKNRGAFVSNALGDATEYPLGAGLGRWGLMNGYFGTPDGSLWAEIMWQAWIYDGGIPLVLLYATALIVAVRVSWSAAIARDKGPLGDWAAVIFAFDLAAVAASFVYPIFALQPGIDVWLMNAVLFGAWSTDAAAAAQRGGGNTAAPAPRHAQPARSAKPLRLLGGRVAGTRS